MRNLGKGVHERWSPWWKELETGSEFHFEPQALSLVVLLGRCFFGFVFFFSLWNLVSYSAKIWMVLPFSQSAAKTAWTMRCLLQALGDSVCNFSLFYLFFPFFEENLFSIY